MSDLAPIAIFVYKREEHARTMLESLSACHKACESELFIYADGPKSSEDIEAVYKVRELIHETRWIQGFKNVTIIESNQNKGLANSVVAGVTDIINRFGKIIVIEDDLILSKQFLVFMNQALGAFEEDKDRVFAISGWTYPLPSLGRLSKDAWAYYRACSWGWATWKDRWDKVEFDPLKAGFAEKLSNQMWCKKFSRGGSDLPGMLQMQLEGKRDSWAIRWNATASDLDMITIYPTSSNVFNNGRDGSGTHCGKLAYTQLGFDEGKENYDFSEIVLDDKLVKEAWRFDSDTLDKKIRRNLRTIFVEHKVPNVIKKLIKH